MIEKIYDKIESYHMFNYAVPGALFLLLCKLLCGLNITEDKTIVFLLMSYFCGIVISRIGSLVVSNLLNRLFGIELEGYREYITAAKSDKKIDILMQDGNMYRNMCTMILMLLFIKVFTMLKLHAMISTEILIIAILLILIILFSISYRKQEKIIISRVKIANSKKK